MIPEQEKIYREMYMANGRNIYQYLLRMTGNAADAEDLLQEVFLVLLFKLDLFASGHPNNANQVFAFLLGVAKKQLLHYWRRHYKLLDMEISTELLSDLSDPKNDFSDSEFSLPDHLAPMGKQLLHLLNSGYSLKESAFQLGINPAACRMRYSRLKAHLKKILKNEK